MFMCFHGAKAFAPFSFLVVYGRVWPRAASRVPCGLMFWCWPLRWAPPPNPLFFVDKTLFSLPFAATLAVAVLEHSNLSG